MWTLFSSTSWKRKLICINHFLMMRGIWCRSISKSWRIRWVSRPSSMVIRWSRYLLIPRRSMCRGTWYSIFLRRKQGRRRCVNMGRWRRRQIVCRLLRLLRKKKDQYSIRRWRLEVVLLVSECKWIYRRLQKHLEEETKIFLERLRLNWLILNLDS